MVELRLKGERKCIFAFGLSSHRCESLILTWTRVWTRLSSTCQGRQGRLPVSLWSSAPTYSRPLERVKRSKRCHYSALTNTGALLISCLRLMHCIIQSVQRTIRFSHFGSSMLPINQPRNAKSRLKAADIETLTFSWQHAPPKTHSVTK